MFKKPKGQSALEYALIIAVVVAGLLAMQIYMKRGVQGKLRESIDEIGEQYSAGDVTAKYTTEQTGNMTTKEEFGTTAAGGVGRGVSKYEVTTPAEIKRTATGADAEKITTNLTAEDLFD